MAYEIIGWKNKGETGAKPINRDNLRHMDNGILNLDTYKAEIMPLLVVSNTAPAECERGDLYYNTTTELIYVATQPDTWSEEGTTPSTFSLYVDLSSSKLYYYDGTNFNSYGSGGDNLPVGVEMDFDGTSQDIPTGWQQISNITQILWTNSNPTQAISETINITLSSSNYDMIEIYYIQTVSNQSLMYSSKVLKGNSTRMRISTTDSANIYRGMTYLSDTSYRIDLPYSDVSLPNVSSMVIPVYIIGYKTGINI